MRILSSLIFSLIVMGWSSSLFAISIDLKGSIGRGADVKQMPLEIVLSGVDAADLIDGSIDKTATQRLGIFLVNHPDSTLRVRHQDEPTNTNAEYLEGFVLRKTAEAEQTNDPSSATRFNVRLYYVLEDTGSSHGFKELLAANEQKIKIRARYIPAPPAEEKEQEFTIDQQVGVASVAPQNFTLSSEHLGLKMKWDAVDKVAFNKGGDAKPNSVNVVFINTSVLSNASGADGFKAITYKEDKTLEQQDATCEFTANETGCEIYCPEGAYLDIPSLKARAGVTVLNVIHPRNSTSRIGLDTTKTYAAFASYEPDGLKQSACAIGMAKENSSLSELNGGDAAKPGDATCFVATAAYGNALHPHLVSLRWFRDRILVLTKPGQAFIRFYYQHGPGWAAWLKQHETARQAVRYGLFLPAAYLSSWRVQPWLTLTLTLSVIIGVTLFLNRPRRT